MLLYAIFRAKGTRCCLQKRRLLRENIRAAKRIIGNTLALQTAMWLEKLTRDFGFSIRQNQAIVRASLRGPVRRRPLVAQHTRHVFRSPGNDGPAERMDRTSRAAPREMTDSGITSRGCKSMPSSSARLLASAIFSPSTLWLSIRLVSVSINTPENDVIVATDTATKPRAKLSF